MTIKKKVFWIATLIIVVAVVIVLCVGYFQEKPSEYDGTLVRVNTEYQAFVINDLNMII